MGNSEIAVELSNDEVTCLAIAAGGVSMMAIGRWEQPVERLVGLGLLRQYDKFNNLITPDGKLALERHDQRQDDEFLRLSSQVKRTRDQARNAIEQAAEKLVEATTAQQELIGGLPNQIAYSVSQQVLARALELLK